MEPEEDQELHSFPYEAIIAGKEHFYRIRQTMKSRAQNRTAAYLPSFTDHWQKVSGEPLSRELLDSICVHIEAHYG